MGQRLKKSSLFFSQAGEKEPPKPTLSGFYQGVGESQAQAVQDVAKGVKETTAKLPGEFGIKYGAEGGAEFADKSVFKPTVDIKTGISETPVSTGFSTSEQAGQAATQAGKNVQQLAEEKKQAEASLGKSTEESLTKAGEASKTAQERLTEKKLGERRESSELEKASQDYRNILQTTPGTSNVTAVANLMKFYDPKYKPLESVLRQGEISLARQQAGATEAAMQQAEGERTGAIEAYRKTAEQSYTDAKNKIAAEKEAKLSEIKKFYDPKIESETGRGAAAAQKAEELKKVENEAAVKNLDAASDAVKNSRTVTGLDDILKAISGRGGDNWLNTRGTEVLGGIRGEITELTEEAIAIKNDPALTLKQRTDKLNKIGERVDSYRGKIAGELAAFLGDQNTQPVDALDAAGHIVSAGLVDSLNENQKRVMRDRLFKDVQTSGSNRESNYASINRLEAIYKALGGTEDIRSKATKQLDEEYGGE